MAARVPRHIGKTAKKVGEAAKKGEIVQFGKPLRPGQRHRTRAKKARIVTTFVEAEEVAARANKMIGADAFRLRGIQHAKILFLFTSAERITGCMGGRIRVARFPRTFRYKSQLKFDFYVLIPRPQWDRAEDDEKSRVLYHGLREMGSDTAGRWHIEPHDIEGFISEVEFFGLRSPEIRRIAEQLQLDLGKA